MSSPEEEYRGYSIKWDVIYKADTDYSPRKLQSSRIPDTSGIRSIPSRAVIILQQGEALDYIIGAAKKWIDDAQG